VKRGLYGSETKAVGLKQGPNQLPAKLTDRSWTVHSEDPQSWTAGLWRPVNRETDLMHQRPCTFGISPNSQKLDAASQSVCSRTWRGL